MAFDRRKSRINCAAQGVRRAVDLILHGASAELLNEGFVENEREAWVILGTAACEEIQDHGFMIEPDEDGNISISDELERPDDEP